MNAPMPLIGHMTIICALSASLYCCFDPIPKNQIDKEKIEKAVFGEWYEDKVIVNGMINPKEHEFMSWKLGSKIAESCTLTGEVQYDTNNETIIDISKQIWRIDIIRIEEGKKSVLPGIFKIENGTLIWCISHWANDSSDGEYKCRPDTFESTEKNQFTVKFLRPLKEYEEKRKKK